MLRVDRYRSYFLRCFNVSQFNLKLPAEVDEYYSIRAKCEAAGWQPGAVSLFHECISHYLLFVHSLFGHGKPLYLTRARDPFLFFIYSE